MTALNSYLLGYACREPWNMHAVRRWDSVPSDRATAVGNMASIQRFAQGTPAAATLSERAPSS